MQKDAVRAVSIAFEPGRFSPTHLTRGIRKEFEGWESRYFKEIIESATSSQIGSVAEENDHPIQQVNFSFLFHYQATFY